MASEKEASEETALEETALEETVVGLLKKKKMSWSKEEHTEERGCCLSQMCRTDGKRRGESSQNRCLPFCDRTCGSGWRNRRNTGRNRIYGMLLCRKDNCKGISL